MWFRGLSLLCTVLGAGLAHADPVTYSGTLGKTDIVVEFTSDPAKPDGPVAGRYFYRSQGIDIPLQARPAKGKGLELSEEEACKAKCEEGKPGPVGAIWRLEASGDGKTLKGSWTGKKTFSIALKRAGSRPAGEDQPRTPLDLYNFTSAGFYEDRAPISMATAPYDYLRLDVPLTEGKAEGWPDARFRYVNDPRTKFPMPRIVSLSGGVPFDLANRLLQERHWRDSLAALGCAALQYAGFQEYGPIPGSEGGSLGGYDESSSKVAALTPKLMSWRESGSVYCGGAHPTNYFSAYTLDVATGQRLELGDMFADVVDGNPGSRLLAFVRDAREKPAEQSEIDFEAECGMDGLIAEYLVASLIREGDRLDIVFGLQGLPHVMQACGDDFLQLPVERARALFTPSFRTLLAQ